MDLHDDVGATRTAISLKASLMRSAVEVDPGGARRIAEGVQQEAQGAVESMSDVVWALGAENDSAVDLGRRIRFFATNATPEDWKLDIQVGGLHGRRLDPETRRNVYLVAKEAIHNAVKHSRATSLVVALTESGGWLRLTVADDGGGIGDEAGLRDT